MCRLLGVIASKPVDLEYFLVTGPRPFRDLGGLKAPDWVPYQEKNFHPDGWGLGWYESGTPRIRKRPEPAAQSAELPLVAAEARSKIMFGHVRKASLGEKTERNCHPFAYRNWLFTHNGTVAREPLIEMLNAEHRAAIQGTTDSEVFFHYILQAMEQEPCNAEAGIRGALEEVRRHEVKGMNLLLTDGESLYAFKYSSKEEDYYSLGYLLLDQWPASARTTTSPPEHRDTIDHVEGLKAVLVCSEKLVEGPWNDIPPGHLLVVSPQIDCRLIPVFESDANGRKE